MADVSGQSWAGDRLNAHVNPNELKQRERNAGAGAVVPGPISSNTLRIEAGEVVFQNRDGFISSCLNGVKQDDLGDLVPIGVAVSKSTPSSKVLAVQIGGAAPVAYNGSETIKAGDPVYAVLDDEARGKPGYRPSKGRSINEAMVVLTNKPLSLSEKGRKQISDGLEQRIELALKKLDVASAAGDTDKEEWYDFKKKYLNSLADFFGDANTKHSKRGLRLIEKEYHRIRKSARRSRLIGRAMRDMEPGDVGEIHLNLE